MMENEMKRYWFRVRIDEDTNKVLKVLIQAPDYDAAVNLLEKSIEQYYPCSPDFVILNDARATLPDDTSYVVIADSKSSHFTSLV